MAPNVNKGRATLNSKNEGILTKIKIVSFCSDIHRLEDRAQENGIYKDGFHGK